jgi:hypothetical protein
MPAPHHVYADFNAIEYPGDGSCYARLPLTGYGTLASLAAQKLRLIEGLELVLYEPNDVECTATVHFDSARPGPAGIIGEWVAIIQDNNFRDCEVCADQEFRHACYGCGIDLESNQPVGWRSYHELCGSCGTPVMAPLAPPTGAA